MGFEPCLGGGRVRWRVYHQEMCGIGRRHGVRGLGAVEQTCMLAILSSIFTFGAWYTLGPSKLPKELGVKVATL